VSPDTKFKHLTKTKAEFISISRPWNTYAHSSTTSLTHNEPVQLGDNLLRISCN